MTMLASVAHASINDASTKDALRQFVTTQLLMQPGMSLDDDEELLLSGLVDSLGAVRLINFVESELSVQVPPEDVVIEHFQSINAIAAYLNQRRPAG
jgi:acyl carrier protein